MSGVRQLRVSIDFVLLEHDLFGRPNLHVWCGYVGSLELYSVQNGSVTDMQYRYRALGIIVHPFAGSFGS